ncbi:MAG: hypothetical protein M1833_000129 [Piccolia ochrophora]|nr:MAG: hypothetical protein M1833_000129 [Piccolia ochrophora]
MADGRAQSLAIIYNERSASYDDSFHPRQAADFIDGGKLKPGDSVLDLACGTGLVSLLAKQCVGGNGRVLGVDVSQDMLAEARRKAIAQAMDVSFICGDVTDLKRKDLLPCEEPGFDLITCAAAFILLRDPRAALAHWATFFAPGGRIIVDVPTERTMTAGLILEDLARQEGMPEGMLSNRLWVKSEDSLRQLIADSGLTAECVFTTDNYDTQATTCDEIPHLLEKVLKYTPFQDVKDETMKQRVKSHFVEHVRRLAGPKGKVSEEVSFYIGIARGGP